MINEGKKRKNKTAYNLLDSNETCIRYSYDENDEENDIKVRETTGNEIVLNGNQESNVYDIQD